MPVLLGSSRLAVPLSESIRRGGLLIERGGQRAIAQLVVSSAVRSLSASLGANFFRHLDGPRSGEALANHVMVVNQFPARPKHAASGGTDLGAPAVFFVGDLFTEV